MAEPKRYRKKPVEIEAIQWDGSAEGATQIIDWVLAAGGCARFHDAHEGWCIAVDTLEGTMGGGPDYWFIKGVKGEFYPCKPDIFEATYTAALAKKDIDNARLKEHVGNLQAKISRQRRQLRKIVEKGAAVPEVHDSSITWDGKTWFAEEPYQRAWNERHRYAKRMVDLEVMNHGLKEQLAALINPEAIGDPDQVPIVQLPDLGLGPAPCDDCVYDAQAYLGGRGWRVIEMCERHSTMSETMVCSTCEGLGEVTRASDGASDPCAACGGTGVRGGCF